MKRKKIGFYVSEEEAAEIEARRAATQIDSLSEYLRIIVLKGATPIYVERYSSEELDSIGEAIMLMKNDGTMMKKKLYYESMSTEDRYNLFKTANEMIRTADKLKREIIEKRIVSPTEDFERRFAYASDKTNSNHHEA